MSIEQSRTVGSERSLRICSLSVSCCFCLASLLACTESRSDASCVTPFPKLCTSNSADFASTDSLNRLLCKPRAAEAAVAAAELGLLGWSESRNSSSSWLEKKEWSMVERPIWMPLPPPLLAPPLAKREVGGRFCRGDSTIITRPEAWDKATMCFLLLQWARGSLLQRRLW